MSQLTDAEIVAALRHAVPEPPVGPDRVSVVHRRARAHRRNQLSALALAVVAVGGAGTAVLSQQPAPHPEAGLAAPVVPMTGIPASLYRPSQLRTISAGTACPVSPSHTFPAGQGFSDAYDGIGDGPFVMTGDGKLEVNFTTPSNDAYFGTGWPGTKAIWRISDAYAGPILVRGARLDGTGMVQFDRYDTGLVGAAGSVGTPFPTLGYITSAGIGASTYPDAIRVQSPGCYGLQVDGTNFTEVITFSVTSVHD